MSSIELIAPCHFGLEAVLKKEIAGLGLPVTAVQDGRVTFTGSMEDVARANLSLRTAERVLLKVGSFMAERFDDLFEGTKALPWEDFLPFNARFWVTKAASVKSKLFSPSDIQSVMKKAMVERLKQSYHLEHFPESGADYPVRVFLLKDEVTVTIDTTGASLHKRGYRLQEVEAPIAENLAAALLMLTPWKRDRILIDPFCGSGTIPIEAAMMACRIAPGINRQFTAESWSNLLRGNVWGEERERLRAEEDRSLTLDIQGFDISEKAVAVAMDSAARAGVRDLIHFQVRDVAALSHKKPYGFLVTNPPYGERIGADTDLDALYRTLGERFLALPDWSLYLITAFEGAEKAIGKRAAKNRKIYNGMIKTYFYQFPGAKPKGRQDSGRNA